MCKVSDLLSSAIYLIYATPEGVLRNTQKLYHLGHLSQQNRHYLLLELLLSTGDKEL